MSRPTFGNLWPALAAIVLIFFHRTIGNLGATQLGLIAALLIFFYVKPLRLIAGLIAPFLLILVAYDLHRYWPDAWRGAIHITQPHAWEISWFGIMEDGVKVTPAHWWQTRTHAVLDVIAGVAYLGFVPVFIGAAAWWRLRGITTAGASKLPAAERAMWALCVMYVLGYVFYLIYPAAPPWYFDRYGAELVRNAPPEAAGAARFDVAVGVPVFGQYYGQSTNVFGAIPSLHWGTAFLLVLYAMRLKSLRVIALLLFAAVAFGSVYLNHHYIVDGLVGMLFATLAFLAWEWRRGQAT